MFNWESVAGLKTICRWIGFYIECEGGNLYNLQRTCISIRCYKAQKLSKLSDSLINWKEYAELEWFQITILNLTLTLFYKVDVNEILVN